MQRTKRREPLYALAALLITSLAQGSPVVWTLDGLTFDDGATASGSFTYDADTNTLITWQIDVVGMPTFADCTYEDATALPAPAPTSSQLTFDSPCSDGDRRLQLDTAAPLTNAGGSVGLLASSMEKFISIDSARGVSAGTLTAPPPPPPPPRTEVTDTGLRLPELNQYNDPVVLTTGAYRFSALLMNGPGQLMPFELIVSYTSTESDALPLGRKWTHNFNWRIDEFSGGGVVRVKQGDGAADFYASAGGGNYVPEQPGVPETLVRNPDDTWVWTSIEGDRYLFAADGKLTSILDSNDNTFTLAYDLMGRLVTVTDATSLVATFAYDGADRITSVDLGGLESTTFSYTGDDLSSYTVPGAATTAFTYDTDGNLLTLTLDGQLVLTNTYDAQDRVVSQTDAQGNIKTIAYSIGGGGQRIATVTDGESNTQSREYDDDSLLVAWTDMLGGSWSFTHDANGDELSVTDGLGNTSTKTYDANGNLLTDTDALGHTQTFTYDGDGNIETITDPLGHVVRLFYDSAGNLASIVDQLENPTFFTYSATDIRGMVIETSDRHFHLTTQTWTPSGELATLTDPSGATFTFSYDALGRLTQVADPLGNSVLYGHDAAGNITSITDPLGHVTTHTYDARGNLTSETEPNGAVSTATLTPAGDVASITDPVGNTWTYNYDGERRVTRRTDPVGNQTNFAWNAAGKVTSTADTEGGVVTASYDGGGNVTSVTDPNGNTASFAYDAVGQLVTETDALGNVITNTYDPRGQISSVVNGRGQVISYAYDPAGRRTVTTLSDTSTITHSWAAGSNLLTLTGPSGTISHTYDVNDYMTSRTDVYGNTVQYVYDALGNITQIVYSDGKTVNYTYDANARLIQVQDWAGRITSYTYNNVGALVSTLLPDGSTVQHVVDLASRTASLTDAAPDGATIFRSVHTRDPLGRTTSETVQMPAWPAATMTADVRTFTHNPGNQIVAEDGTPFAHDADGNTTSGAIAGGVSQTMTYNDRNQLTSIGADTYEYDAAGLRIRSTVGGVVRRYVWDTIHDGHARVLEEHDGTGTVVARYVHGVGLISREDAGGNLRVYHYDTRGSTVALTDATGAITDRYAYDPYGRLVQHTGVTPNPFRYNGRDSVVHDDNGVTFTHSRVYAPALMRFLQTDPFARGHLMSTQTLNRYLYVRGNPIELIDPRGDVPAVAIGVAVGAGAGFGGQFAANLASGRTDFSFGKNGMFYNTPGATLGGAVTGALDVYAVAAGPLGLAASGAFGAAVGNGTNQLLNIYVFGNQNKFDPIDFGVEVGTAAVLGGVTGKIGKWADEAAPDSKVVTYLGNVIEETIEFDQAGPILYKTIVRPARANKFISSTVVKGTKTAVEHRRKIHRAVKKPSRTAYNWSRKTGRKIGGFFSSNKKGKSKVKKAARSVSKKARKIGRKIKGWF